MNAIEVHERVEKGKTSTCSKYRVTFPCCNSEGVITLQQIKKWQQGYVEHCKTCAATFQTKREKATGYTISPEKEARIGRELAMFTKMMYELNHA